MPTIGIPALPEPSRLPGMTDAQLLDGYLTHILPTCEGGRNRALSDLTRAPLYGRPVLDNPNITLAAMWRAADYSYIFDIASRGVEARARPWVTWFQDAKEALFSLLDDAEIVMRRAKWFCRAADHLRAGELLWPGNPHFRVDPQVPGLPRRYESWHRLFTHGERRSLNWAAFLFLRSLDSLVYDPRGVNKAIGGLRAAVGLLGEHYSNVREYVVGEEPPITRAYIIQRLTATHRRQSNGR